MDVAQGVSRHGTRNVNWYLVEDRGRFTVVDAGMPQHWGQLTAALRSKGRSLADVEAVVLTHAHVDHTGFAERARIEAKAAVHVHRADEAGGVRRFPPMWLYWRPTSWPLLAEAVRDGLLLTKRITEARTFDDGEVIDVPGRPRVVHLPGHTAGSCALHLDDRDVVFSGDALVTLDPYTRGVGPRLLLDGVHEDPDEARRSLQRLSAVTAGVLLPGHGEPWTGGTGAAVSAALSPS